MGSAIDTFTARLLDLARVSNARDAIQRLTLEVPSNYGFTAGQYLLAQHPRGISIPLSIASAPDRLPQLELHYRSDPNQPEAKAMDALIDLGEFQISAPQGNVKPGPDDRALWIICGGTGAAQAFSCVEQRAGRTSAPTSVLWCADSANEFYGETQLRDYGAILTTITDDRRTTENEGLVWLAQHCKAFTDATIIIAGAPGFVWAATDVLLDSGFTMDDLQSDVYAYAPRD